MRVKLCGGARYNSSVAVSLTKIIDGKPAVSDTLLNEQMRALRANHGQTTQTGQELCSRCGHERDFHGPDCRAETSDKRYLHLCPCIAFVPPKEPNTQRKPPCKQVTH